MITININELKTPEQIEEAYREALFHVDQYEYAGIGDTAEAWANFEAVCAMKENVEAEEKESDTSICEINEPTAPTTAIALLKPEWAFIDDREPEWKQAWLSFEDPRQLNHGETLQYMGSDNRTGTWKHCFRHRCDPITGERKYYHIDASPNWKPQNAKPCQF